MADTQLFEKAISWAKNQGFSKIKANTDDYETPVSFKKAGEETPFVPDITGVRLGGKSYVEIATKSDDVRRKVTKWKLLSTLAAMKQGKLYLLAPRGHKSFTEGIVERHNISANVISI